jgi:hypothetical protein
VNLTVVLSIASAAAIAVIAFARSSSGADSSLAATNLYPHVVPASYLQHGGRELSKPLGHDLHVALVFDRGGVVQSATSDNLHNLGLSVDEAHAVALRNLDRLAAEQQVKMAVFPDGPGSRPFVLVGGHWAAASSILLPNLNRTVSVPLGTQNLCASIPHRQAMLIFACGDRAYRDSMRALVREKEADGDKPLTHELFRLNQSGIEPLIE